MFKMIKMSLVFTIMSIGAALFVNSAKADWSRDGRVCYNPRHWNDINSYPYGYRGCGWYAGRWWPGGYAGYRRAQPPYYTTYTEDTMTSDCPNPRHWNDINSYPYGYRGCGWYAGRWWPGGYAGYRRAPHRHYSHGPQFWFGGSF
jgi:hypothetical protein